MLGRPDPERRDSRRTAVLRHPPVRFWYVNPLAWLALLALGSYRRLVPAAAKPQCRFVPTCSAYAAEAIHRYGVRNGMKRAMLRIHRCIGFGGSGYDPV